MNAHNNHLWAIENPHITASTTFQARFSVNVCSDVLNHRFIRLYIFDQSINSQRYLDFLHKNLDELLNLEELPLKTRQNLTYKYDGAPAYLTNIVTEYLNAKFSGRWIGYNSPYRL